MFVGNETVCSRGVISNTGAITMQGYRELLTKEEFEALRRTATKRELIEILSRYVARPKGKPMVGDRPLTAAEKMRRYRERQRLNRD